MQTVHHASQFPATPILITELRWRPNVGVGPFTATVTNLQINLSTTAKNPNGLSGTFASNVGADNTQVFSNTITLTATAPAAGPHPFELRVPLSTPFPFNPANGNLLVDVRNFVASSVPGVGGEPNSGQSSRAVAVGNANATMAGYQDTGGDALEIVYVPAALGPQITSQPQDQTTIVGGTASFSVTANGGALNYQWYHGVGALPNQTNATLNLANVQLANAGDYSVVVANGFDSVTSSNATLTVLALPSTTTLVVPNIAATRELNFGGATLREISRVQTVHHASQFPPAPIVITELRWRPNVGGGPFTATVTNLQINLSTTAKNPNGLSGTFASNVGADDTRVFSNTVTLTATAPAAGPHPFELRVTLSTPFSYNPANGNLLVDLRNFTGSTSPGVGGEPNSGQSSRAVALSPNATTASFTDTGADALEIVYAMLNTAPFITQQPQNQSAVVGDDVTFTVQANGTQPLSYQWYQGATPLAGQTNPTLALLDVQLSQAGTYSVVVANAFGSLPSANATLAVSLPPFLSSLVVPNIAATREQNFGGGTLREASRVQAVHHASQFPAGSLLITELRWRPNVGIGPFTATVSNLQINLSTTAKNPNGLSETFASNVGADNTMVFSNTVTLTATAPAAGPHPFELRIPLSTPFLYQPANGNLLVDLRNFLGSTSPGVGGEQNSGQSSRAVALNPNATLAGFRDTGADALELVYIAADTLPDVLTGPVTNPANGHLYYLLSGANWSQSEAKARLLGGHLATINDATEDAWVYSTFSSHGGTPRALWIGLNDAEQEGGFTWVDGDAATYRNFSPGEPNNFNSGQDFVNIFPPGDPRAGTWDDQNNLANLPDAANTPLHGVVEIIPDNLPPNADAGATLLTVISPNNVDAQVILDGSFSSDPDGDPLSYQWRDGNTDELLASGIVGIIARPIGSNPIKLVVSDGLAQDTDTIIVVVKTAAQSVQDLIALVNQSNIPRNPQALLASLEAALESFNAGNFATGVNQLEAFQQKVRAQVGPDDPVLADTLISLAQQIIDAIQFAGGGAPAGMLHTDMNFTAVKRQANGRAMLNFPGWPHRVYLIQASTDLVTWETIGTGRHIEKGAFEFEDNQSAPHAMRFYRLVLP